MDSQRARSVHYNSNQACLEFRVQHETSARPVVAAGLSIPTYSDSGEQASSHMDADPFPEIDSADDFGVDDDDGGDPSPDSHHSFSSSTDSSLESNPWTEPFEPFESEGELDASSGSFVHDLSDESSSGDESHPDPEGEENREEQDDDEIDPKCFAQLKLESFLGQPSTADALPEDLDMSYRILNTLQRAGAPLSCFEEVAELTRRAHKMQVPLAPATRDKVMADLRKRFHQTELTPVQTTLQLPSGRIAKISTIDFCSALGSLLSMNTSSSTQRKMVPPWVSLHWSRPMSWSTYWMVMFVGKLIGCTADPKMTFCYPSPSSSTKPTPITMGD